MAKKINICNIYIFLCCLYNLQGILYPSGSFISQSILGIIIIISCYYFTYLNLKYKVNYFFKALNYLLAMFTLYGIILLLNRNEIIIMSDSWRIVPNYYYLKNIYFSLLPIYAFFIFSKKGFLPERKMQKLTFLFLLIVFLNYLRFHNEAILRADLAGYSIEEVTNNIGYEFLALLPFVFLFDKKHYIKFLLLIFLVVFILMCMKRGAIMISSIVCLWIFYISYRNALKKQKIFLILLFLLFITSIIYYINYMLISSDYFNERIESTLAGDASAREDYYPQLINYIFYGTSFFQFLFGAGAYATIDVIGNLAHNDWLEIAVNQGLLGVFIYLFFWISFYKTVNSLKGNYKDHNCYAMLVSIFIIVFLKTLFSMSYGSMSLYTAIGLGYCLSKK